METNLQKIQKLIIGSKLSKTEQDDFVTLLALVSDTELEPMAQLLSEDQNWFEKIYQNVKAKRAALVSGDSTSWEEIIREEETQLKELER